MIKRTRKTYTARQKISALELCENRGVAICSKRKGIPIPTLYKWLKDRANGIEMTSNKRGRKKKEVKCSVCRGKVESSGH